MAKILLVEDDPEYRDYMRSILDDADHEVTEAADGREALEALSAGDFDIVVTDVLMPNVSGKELIEEIYSRAEGYLPIVVITGGGTGDPGVVLKTVEHLGVTASLEKPVSPEVLTRTVRDALEWL